MLFSVDGINWARITGGSGVGNTQFDTGMFSSINDIAFGDGRFVAVGQRVLSGSFNAQMAVSTN